ncbi:GDSL-type esterase/lipase family protein [Epilithonimonas zeae]|uniref:GDSL-type esterase/lipase family protein n=1 Tax=Epilithonimonas zeae TaxID=1416779 RepID=UPI00200CDCC0|nr:GDSL-type esterase/lipase family protein [Epilithonimonas zeae]UQB69956.1 G-D-S-L family lipolytic protein [Epilithonimonas zeae]
MKYNRQLFKKLFFLAMILNSLLFFAQDKPYWKEIQEFKKLDEINGISKKPILFLGSSSFTYWKDVNDYFPGKTIINRGFGGSRLLDLNNYSEELLTPYNPKQIVIYCGENDIATDNPSSAEVLERFKTFFGKIRAKYPKVPVAYVSIKYSPSREQFWPQMKELNQSIQAYLKTQKRAKYIDITKVMNDENGKVKTDIFKEDMLHMKPEGYRLWAKVIEPYLK